MEVPKPTGKDTLYTSIKATLGTFPYAGAAASELLGLLITPPLEKRRQEWMEDVGERLKKLEELEHIDLDTLSTNEQFIDTVLQATTLALKTSQLDKLTAFKNIITNTAKGVVPDETRCQIFMSIVGDFTVWHLDILHLFNNIKEWYQANKKTMNFEDRYGIPLVIKGALPELNGEDELVDLIWNDLQRVGFFDSSRFRGTLIGDLVKRPPVTKLGKEFIAFISNHQ